jgi:phosphatidylserine decarboxylase
MSVPYRVGAWLPSDQSVLDKWLKELIEDVDGVDETDAEEDVDADVNPRMLKLHPVIEDFKITIDTDAEINMFFHQMFNQVPQKPPYNENPTGKPQVRNYHMMLRLINAIMTRAPEFNQTGLVGFPINAILDWSMGTPGGFAAFLNDTVNLHLKRVLNAWGVFLKSSASTYVLSDDPHKGWFGEDALNAMPHFAEDFVCDPCKTHYGFTSWDDFFTRVFREGVRPVAFPHDDNVIANACESAPYKLLRDVKRRDKFWIKAQRYSLEFMLGNDSLTEQFVGGTVYQAFLSALSYHRWHSPVSGFVKKTVLVEGSYYSETLNEGFDPSGPNKSQGYITQVAARALIFIQADNPAIGLMCFMAVGMAEVSSNEITVFEGQKIKKGQEIGMFHFGGSTHCLIFRPGVNLQFDLHHHDQKPGLHSKNINVRAQIATVIDQ